MSPKTYDSTSTPRQLAIILAGFGTGLLICVGASCGPNGEQRYQDRLAQTGRPAMHAVQSERLRELMGDLSYSMSLDPPDRYTEPARKSRKIAQVADEMVKTATDVVAAEKEFKLDAKDREVFLALAQKLRDSARDISTSASRQDYEGTKSAISRMQSTCNACHNLFRTMAGTTY